MSDLGIKGVQLAGSAGLTIILVAIFRDRLLRFAAVRRLRFVEGVLLFLFQVLSAILIGAIDFHTAFIKHALSPADGKTFNALTAATSIAAGLQTFILLHADFAEIERAALSNQLKDARLDFRFLSDVANTFVRVVSRKRERLAKVVSPDELLLALNPSLQLAALIAACWEVVNAMINTDRGTHRVRVAYYRCVARKLVLAHCWNGTASDCVPQWDDTVQKRFRLNDPNGCLAVAAAKDGAMYRVKDTTTAHDDARHPFVFFADRERDELKSIAALPIKIEGDSAPYAVLVVDTSREGFFDDSDQRQELQLQQIIFHLAHRLHLEEKVSGVIGEQ